MDELATVVREAYTKHPEVHEHLREWLLSDDGMEMAQEYDVAALELNNVSLQPREVKDLLQENKERVAAEKQHPELFPLASLTRRLTVRQGLAIGTFLMQRGVAVVSNDVNPAHAADLASDACQPDFWRSMQKKGLKAVVCSPCARDKEQLVRQPRDAGWLFVADPEAPLGLV
ncbi:hypothetical protein RI054_33g128580 [Pseudoscourfieldia marina]